MAERTEPFHAASSVSPRLSAREQEVLIAWLRTDSKVAVAKTLFITPTTVRTHIQRIRHKYKAVGRPASTKAALTVRAIQDGFITADELSMPEILATDGRVGEPATSRRIVLAPIRLDRRSNVRILLDEAPAPTCVRFNTPSGQKRCCASCDVRVHTAISGGPTQ